MKYTFYRIFFFAFLACFGAIEAHSQVLTQLFKGRVIDVQTQKPIEGTHIVNMTSFHGTTSNSSGFFTIEAAPGDSLYISNIAYATEGVAVTAAMFKREYTNIYMVSKAYELGEVTIRSHYLTGLLDVDVRSLDPVFTYKVLEIEGLKTSENLRQTPARVTPFSPVEFVSKFFSKDRKLERLKKEDSVNDMLALKYDREFLTKAFGITREELEDLLLYCNQDPKWVIKASDLEILDALSKCYESWNQEKAEASEKRPETPAP